MNRKRIRDPRRLPFRFRFTDKTTGAGTTTWPMLRHEANQEKQQINPAVHVSAIITKQGKRIKPNA